MKPLPGSVGVVVCEPSGASLDPSTLAFGAGCARWLQFTIGGLGELGKTPTWTAVARAEREMGRTDLRLTAQDAEALHAMTGATHIGVGTVTKQGDKLTLTYQWIAAKQKKVIGKPVHISGSPTEISAALPRLAHALAAQVGVEGSHLPASADATQTDLDLIGSLSWLPEKGMTPTERQALIKAAEHLPLAGMLAIRTDVTSTSEQFKAAMGRLYRQTPENALALEECEHQAGKPALHADLIERNTRRYPHNYLFATVSTWLFRDLGDQKSELTAAKQAVSNAYDNPDAWLVLGRTIENRGTAIRKGRYFSQLSADEVDFLNQVYPLWLRTVEHAAELDPNDGRAWLRVCEAAAFQGNHEEAESAFDQALQLDSDDADVYDWGLQLFQHKWLNRPDRLRELAEKAIVFFSYGPSAFSAVQALKDSQLTDDADRLSREIVAKNREAVQHNPQDAQALYRLGWALKEQKDFQGAADVFKTMLQVAPNNPDGHFGLAMTYFDQNRFGKAETEFEKTLQLQPAYSGVGFRLGFILKHAGKLNEAERVLKQALIYHPNDNVAQSLLGDVYLTMNKTDEAIQLYRSALRLQPGGSEWWLNLSVALGRKGRWKEAIETGREAEKMAPKDLNTHRNLEYVYAMAHQSKLALQECDTVLAEQPNDLLSHGNRGDVLAQMGRLKEAGTEWDYVLQRQPTGRFADDARKNRAKYSKPGN